MSYREIADFVTDKDGFVDPEKVTAVDLYGLDQAKEMFANGGPSYNTRENLRIIACNKYLARGNHVSSSNA